MKGLLLKDFLVLIKQMKLLLILIPVMAITGGASMASIAILVGAVLPMTAMAYDEQSKWNELAAMMPYSPKDIVLSKYVLGYLCMACAAILFVTAQAVIAAVGHKDMFADLFMILFALICGLLLIAVNIPVSIQYGVQKGRIVFMVFIGLSVAAGMILKDVMPEITGNMISVLPVAAILTAVMLNAISVFISLHLKKS